MSATSLIKLETAIKRYQATDPVLFEAFNAVLDILKEPVADILGPWGKVIQFYNHFAGDFGVRGAGGAWNVVGVAPVIKRAYVLSSDNRMLWYTWAIEECTITIAPVPTLTLALPPGFKAAGGQYANYQYNGWGYNVFANVAEHSIPFVTDDNLGIVKIYRTASVNFPIGTFYCYGSILLPVEKKLLE